MSDRDRQRGIGFMVRWGWLALVGLSSGCIDFFAELPSACTPFDGACTVCSGGASGPPCNGCPAGTVVPEGWVCIPEGRFTMGVAPGPLGCGTTGGNHECHSTPPQGRHIEQAFLMKATEVTLDEWLQRWGDLPCAAGQCVDAGDAGASCAGIGEQCSDLSGPVSFVSLLMALKYLNAESEAHGLTPCYRLMPPAQECALYHRHCNRHGLNDCGDIVAAHAD